MVSEIEPSTCSFAGCDVAQAGVCAQGHKHPKACPNYTATTDDDLEVYADDENTSQEVGKADTRSVALPVGEAMESKDMEGLLRARAATRITIIGDSDSGKSTLLCAIYDRFLRGPFGNLKFAGSRTLVALERRSHYSRVESGRIQPETQRTAVSEGVRYFHFALVPAAKREARVDLLLSDRAGELYRQARGDSRVIAALPEVPQADLIVLLLDGRRVSDPLERANAIQSVRQCLRAFLDSEVLGARSLIQVVVTKIDLVEGSGERQDTESILDAFQARLLRDFGARVRELSVHPRTC